MELRVIRWMAPLLLAAVLGHSQSLWDPSFEGYISAADSFSIGSTLTVQIDTSTKLAFKASRVDSNHISIELAGGATGDLFSFLPSGSTSSAASLSGGSEISVDASVAVRVVAIDVSGSLRVEGRRSIVTGGRTETVEIFGTVDPAIVGDGNRVAASSIADFRLVYSSLLDPGDGPIAAQDLIEVAPSRPEVSSTAPADVTAIEATDPVVATTDPVDAAAPIGSAADSATSPVLTLSDERRSAILLQYLNRLVDLILSSEE